MTDLLKPYAQEVPVVHATHFTEGKEIAEEIIAWLKESSISGAYRAFIAGATDAEGNKVSQDIKEGIIYETLDGRNGFIPTNCYLYFDSTGSLRAIPASIFENTYHLVEDYIPTV